VKFVGIDGTVPRRSHLPCFAELRNYLFRYYPAADLRTRITEKGNPLVGILRRIMGHVYLDFVIY
jgi:hypothetical protein